MSNKKFIVIWSAQENLYVVMIPLSLETFYYYCINDVF
jgi:hypothetical protein